jgi:hypothetical protein
MTTRRLALAFVLAIPLLTGCNPASKVIGTWDLQLEMPEQPTGVGGLGGTYIPPALINAMKPKMNIEFKENGECIVEAYAGGQKAMARGKWKFVKTEKDEMLLKVTMPEAKEKEDQAERELKVRFIDHNNIETVPLPVGDDGWTGLTMKFKRRDF